MGQTLTHGVYLPDEGERNCYSGLAANWQILDTSVGTVAEHTSALAGKAPLVHTHTKSDITDLFNSANTWTKDNTYTKYQNIVVDGTEIGVAPNAQNRNGLLFKDKNGVNIGWLRYQYDTSGDISIEMLVSNKYTAGALNPTGTQIYQGVKQTITSNGTSYFNWSGYVNNSLYPYTTETFNIGDSTHQWNNLYAKRVNTQSVNGINPGALSLPDLASDGYIELSDNISANTEYSYTPTVDGWLALYVQTTSFHAENAVGIFTGGGSSGSYRWACSVTSAINLPRASRYNGAVMLPVKAGIPYLCWITIDSSTALSSKRLYFYKATGNV